MPVVEILAAFKESAGPGGRYAHKGTTPPTYDFGVGGAAAVVAVVVVVAAGAAVSG